MIVNFLKCKNNAFQPKQAKDSDAGYDLFSTEKVILRPFERKLILTGIKIEIPKGYYGRIAPRSGLALKNGIDVMAGVVDSGYRNEIGVVLINLNVLDFILMLIGSILNKVSFNNTFSSLFGLPGEFVINPGDRIAQIIIESCASVEWVEKNELSDSERKTDGFGSSGI